MAEPSSILPFIQPVLATRTLLALVLCVGGYRTAGIYPIFPAEADGLQINQPIGIDRCRVKMPLTDLSSSLCDRRVAHRENNAPLAYFLLDTDMKLHARRLLSAVAAAGIFRKTQVQAHHHPSVNCYTSRKAEQLNAANCLKALDTIVWDDSLSMDIISSPITVGYLDCMIRIEKPKRERPKRDQVFDIVEDVINSCPSRGGVSSYIHGMSAQVFPTSAGNAQDISIPVCTARRCHYDAHDCLSALELLIGPDADNIYFSPSNFTSGNCTLTLTTNDDASFVASYTSTKAVYEKLAKRCSSDPGWVYVQGANPEGQINGIRVSTQGSLCT
ncbi:hypothetical protein PCASD_21429 [Puccinia coronata f. sp. avenae]|uniref:Uncharacterized protein n=2 Tax=Puccinia coronata f. sp. avenae TaxID=200324 RepID=A0A2N5SFD9_9BASI|nr:hypothetical protein PCASD_21429 [Puccinia coronata f. sp. avenae]